MCARRSALPETLTYPRDAVLDVRQVALGLGVSVRSVERADLPTIYIGRLKRYLWSKVLDTLSERSQ